MRNLEYECSHGMQFDISLFIFVTYVVKHVASISYVCCPTPHGVGGLKLYYEEHVRKDARPTPHGVGGLKLPGASGCPVHAVVPPHTGWVD